jgi:hypothetical protein
VTHTASGGDSLTVTEAPATVSAPISPALNLNKSIAQPVDPPPFSGPLAPLNIVTSVVSSLLGWAGWGPSMTVGPVTPIHEPVLWTLLAFVRREIEQTLSGFAPASARHTDGH